MTSYIVTSIIMTMKKKKRNPQRSPLALAILALLIEEPMHPYRIQQLIRERGKDEVINVRQRTSIYQTIDRLLRDELITIREIVQEEGRPDRTIYQVTEEGKRISRIWLQEMLSGPVQEFPDFPVALSFLALLKPQDVQLQLTKRVAMLENENKRILSGLIKYRDSIPRLFMLELEYKRVVISAELEWLHALIQDIDSAKLHWDKKWLDEIAEQLNT